MSRISHKWDISPSEGIELQRKLKSLIVKRWHGGEIRVVGGLDVHFPSKYTARAVAVTVSFPDLKPLEKAIYEGEISFPYIPGLLSFREIPPLLKAIDKLKKLPNIFLCDGQGIAHPRGMGLASHLGLLLDMPTIGCAKSPLYGNFEMPEPERGSKSPIRNDKQETIGYVLRTRSFTKPVFVSIGHRVSLRKAASIVLACSPRYRIPEPLRIAHSMAGER